MKPINYALIALLIAGLLVGCSSAAPESSSAAADLTAAEAIVVTDPFARASRPNGAAYMTLMNNSDRDDALIGANSDVAETVELHQIVMEDNDMMRMQPVERIDIPAGGLATLESGGLHVMLLGINEDLVVGDKFDLTLNFENAGSQTIEVEVREVLGSGHGSMEGMDHSDN